MHDLSFDESKMKKTASNNTMDKKESFVSSDKYTFSNMKEKSKEKTKDAKKGNQKGSIIYLHRVIYP